MTAGKHAAPEAVDTRPTSPITVQFDTLDRVKLNRFQRIALDTAQGEDVDSGAYIDDPERRTAVPYAQAVADVLGWLATGTPTAQLARLLNN